ncbi:MULTISPECIES: ATP synthase subunit I [Thiomicrorhabdus]|uniref:ATP synthase subunit I n=1 Tax=Thiomicrorhabdus heinhorstiae TaxID=2748010 RepID=A0ABS0BZC4_9GAMM|nr:MULTISPECIES: ATP synthase subunit I [Thiomicrorhabdus]MBF6058794.1 ATP synthase subunit I [Thiomicrorhabdus heinhorstiae]
MIKNLDKGFKVQLLIGLVVVAIYATQGQAVAAAYGFFIGIMNVVMLSYTFAKANKKAAESPKSGVLILYLSAVIRFVLLAVLFVLGLSFLDESQAFPVVLTFVLMQLGQLFNLQGKRRLTD